MRGRRSFAARGSSCRGGRRVLAHFDGGFRSGLRAGRQKRGNSFLGENGCVPHLVRAVSRLRAKPGDGEGTGLLAGRGTNCGSGRAEGSGGGRYDAAGQRIAVRPFDSRRNGAAAEAGSPGLQHRNERYFGNGARHSRSQVDGTRTGADQSRRTRTRIDRNGYRHHAHSRLVYDQVSGRPGARNRPGFGLSD